VAEVKKKTEPKSSSSVEFTCCDRNFKIKRLGNSKEKARVKGTDITVIENTKSPANC